MKNQSKSLLLDSLVYLNMMGNSNESCGYLCGLFSEKKYTFSFGILLSMSKMSRMDLF